MGSSGVGGRGLPHPSRCVGQTIFSLSVRVRKRPERWCGFSLSLSFQRPDPSGARARPRPGRVQEALPLKGQVAGPGGGQRPRGAEDEDSAPGRCSAQDVPGTEPASHRPDSWITGETWHRSPSRSPAICPADGCPPRLGARPEEEGRAPRGAEPQDTEASPAPPGGTTSGLTLAGGEPMGLTPTQGGGLLLLSSLWDPPNPSRPPLCTLLPPPPVLLPRPPRC